MTGIVLAGGRNTRMGRNKATLPWQSSDFLHVILQKLTAVCQELIVVTNDPPPSDLSAVHFISDIIPRCGPLSGIHAGLVHSSSPYAFVTACDMPYVQADAVSWMLSQLQGWDVVVPGDDSFMEPLFACYAKTCIPVIEDLLRQDVRKTQALFRRVRCKFIPSDELRAFDPSLRLLQNINSPEDYQAAINEMKGTSML